MKILNQEKVLYILNIGKIIKHSNGDKLVVFSYGVTLHECLKAY